MDTPTTFNPNCYTRQIIETSKQHMAKFNPTSGGRPTLTQELVNRHRRRRMTHPQVVRSTKSNPAEGEPPSCLKPTSKLPLKMAKTRMGLHACRLQVPAHTTIGRKGNKIRLKTTLATHDPRPTHDKQPRQKKTQSPRFTASYEEP